ncbi:hypothetical protein K3G63_04825 [Hymenobacter sp. HSC-4F20]|uniref:hypothetical protein n=1 Tax=Hymenobacter sp. HSC-4F20 TaxID=2864135 RepID=UPI001C73572A|nr:hypothetical protein [Hymenobacter sp. HSC-4F20]MBX0289748.1 hypothetical protein [Hymenobacter sp. HSC-4F20]
MGRFLFYLAWRDGLRPHILFSGKEINTMAERKTFSDTGKQIMPCVMAKTRHALGVTVKRPTNKKYCPEPYWVRVVHEMAAHHGITSQVKIDEAIRKYGEYIVKKV